MDRRAVESFLARLPAIKALVIGDMMLDEYLLGKAERISPEAPVQVVDIASEELRLGGAGNVAANLAALGCRIAVCSALGCDTDATVVADMLTAAGVDIAGLYNETGRRTTRKTRIIASQQQVVRFDRETRQPLGALAEAALIAYIESFAGSYGVLVVSDYLKGTLSAAVMAAVVAAGSKYSLPVVVDPKGSDYGKYAGATVITPNIKEAEQSTGIKIIDEATLQAAARQLLKTLQLQAVLITRSEAGMSLYEADGGTTHLAAVAREVFDVTGAGDTAVALLAAGLACGLKLESAAEVANVAAGIAVSKLGTATVTPGEILAEFSRQHLDCDVKIKNLDTLTTITAAEKARGRKVVFTNGCFDLLHIGHVKYLQQARKCGDLLVLGLNSDSSVRRLKGEKRPLIGQEERAHILAALDCVDFVILFDEDTPLAIIAALQPDVLAKGGDYMDKEVVGRELVEAAGGRVELIPLVGGSSTSAIIEKILASQ